MNAILSGYLCGLAKLSPMLLARDNAWPRPLVLGSQADRERFQVEIAASTGARAHGCWIRRGAGSDRLKPGSKRERPAAAGSNHALCAIPSAPPRIRASAVWLASIAA